MNVDAIIRKGRVTQYEVKPIYLMNREKHKVPRS